MERALFLNETYIRAREHFDRYALTFFILTFLTANIVIEISGKFFSCSSEFSASLMGMPKYDVASKVRRKKNKMIKQENIII